MYDCHLHTKYSFDGKNKMDEVCRTSITHGMKGICFTDHLDLNSVNHADRNHPLDHYLDGAAMWAEFSQMREKYGKQLEMACGTEVGLQRGQGERTKKALVELKPDFVIGSLHYIDNKDIFSGDLSIGKNKQETYLYYLERTLELVKTHDYFHVLGHMDVILRDSKFSDKSMDEPEYRLLLDDILQTLIQNGKGIEVNSSGWRYGLDGPHPQPFIIKRYRELGGTIITTGSDSHIPESINQDIDLVTNILRELGFTAVSYFVKGEEQRRQI